MLTRMDDASIEIVPATAERWPDVERLFGTRGDPSRCWCQYHVTANSYRAPESRQALQDQMQGPIPPGVLAYLGDEPIGWLRISPLGQLPRIAASPSFAKVRPEIPHDTTDVWQAACFVVKVGHRRRGVSAALLTGGVGFARDHGAKVIIGRPIDIPAVESKVFSPNLYVGALSTFLKAGFHEVLRLSPHRPLVRLVV